MAGFYQGFAKEGDADSPRLRETVDELRRLDVTLGLDGEGWRNHYSRRWEFPWAFRASLTCLEGGSDGESITALESGSGVTEIPFYLAARGWHVTGVDLDSDCQAKWGAYAARLPQGTTPPSFKTGDMERLDFGDGAFDLVYSVSAIEHTTDPARAVSEMIRSLSPAAASC